MNRKITAAVAATVLLIAGCGTVTASPAHATITSRPPAVTCQGSAVTQYTATGHWSMHTFLRRHHSDVSTMLDYTIHCARGWPPGFAAYLNKQNWRLFVPAGVKFWDIQPPPSS